ncbi:NADH-quinone oxidoreductase subunit N [Dyadobacter sp. LHD-138]|uniref:NADH-quinone oxidoreductase subunit N n=1 Tax=Dyadobacter sp. LHD-138 TaxID=3071413 RepID=UPI0027DEF6F2|nr:NADH-quinone oxidoreductase subunit N [Dyadobacter sp. LHD-138]MDQ6479240.1 NADH-quinone oxidoreductase subunit N [Dyadobacter sp. LHD-138]
MSDNDFFALTPLLLLSGSAVLIMLLIVAKLSHRIIQISSLILFIISFSSLFYIQKILPYNVGTLFVVDGFGVFVVGLVIFSGLVVNILSYIYFEEKEEGPREYYVLLFLCTLGASVLALSKHFIALFLGLEILTVGLYALIAYLRGRNHSIEAGIKYLVLAAFSSAFLLFGMALIYLETGAMEFQDMIPESAKSLSHLFYTGLGMMLVGVGFKLAVVPFHMWTADVYQGAPAPVTAFIATASKGGVLAVLLRFFIAIDGFKFSPVMFTLTCIAAVSMIFGNLLALRQRNLKRILAYSSVAHMGYLLVAFIPGNLMSLQAVCFYLFTYFVTTLSAFGVVIMMSGKNDDAEDIDEYRALFWKHPGQACILSFAMLSLAGIPLTAGFTGKFYILATAIQSGYWPLAVILVLSSVIGLYYYLRVITAMFTGNKNTIPEEREKHVFFFRTGMLALSVLGAMIIWLGIYPQDVISFISQALVTSDLLFTNF